MKIFIDVMVIALALVGIYITGMNLSQWWSETITGWSLIIFVLVGASSGQSIVRAVKKSAKAKRKAKAKEEKVKEPFLE